MGRVVIGMDPHKRSATRSSTNTSRSWSRAGTARTPSATRRCWRPAGSSRIECGRWKAAPESAAHRSTPGRRRGNRPGRASEAIRAGCGSSTPGKGARPTRSTPTAWPRPDCAALGCARSRSTTRRSRYGWWWIAAPSWATPAPNHPRAARLRTRSRVIDRAGPS